MAWTGGVRELASQAIALFEKAAKEGYDGKMDLAEWHRMMARHASRAGNFLTEAGRSMLAAKYFHYADEHGRASARAATRGFKQNSSSMFIQ